VLNPLIIGDIGGDSFDSGKERDGNCVVIITGVLLFNRKDGNGGAFGILFDTVDIEFDELKI